MKSAIEDFTKTSPKYLREVEIVVFQREMVGLFEEVIDGHGGASKYDLTLHLHQMSTLVNKPLLLLCSGYWYLIMIPLMLAIAVALDIFYPC